MIKFGVNIVEHSALKDARDQTFSTSEYACMDSRQDNLPYVGPLFSAYTALMP